ncbi:MAG TPA: ornithine cyclodeaminase family protein [Alphaproteobacteria bacterium]|nr:ornithine cyclodeaminase family protein [Alphaproteobacteria bacterium]
MRFIGADEVHAGLGYGDLADALARAFREGAEVPVRHRHDLGRDASLLLMPAWREGGATGVKIVTVTPANRTRGLPAIAASFLLFDGETGQPLALIDGPALTERRTAAASALAARYLAPSGAARHLMVGAGALAPHLVRAHAEARPITGVRIWNRTPNRAEALAASLRAEGIDATATEGLEAAARWADIISCATLASEPLIHGAWLRPGQHLDLVGAFRPDMRECDDETVRRARLYVDVRESALAEAGDLAGPLSQGVIAASDIAGDLATLSRGEDAGRTTEDEITLFKSVGTALEDLAAAETLWASLVPVL